MEKSNENVLGSYIDVIQYFVAASLKLLMQQYSIDIFHITV